MFLTAEWRYLAMLNYEVDPALLLKFVPNGTELDSWNDKVFISLVGFRFLKTRVLGMAIPFHCNFSEVNLRFYVRRQVGEELRRGVVFIREIVPRWAIAIIAHRVYNENYVALPMSFQISTGLKRLAVEYAWRSPSGTGNISIATSSDPELPKRNSEAQFITEHYWGYVKQPDGGTMEYRVEHPSWKVWAADRANFTGDTADVYGGEFAKILLSKPTSAFVAEGSSVGVHRGGEGFVTKSRTTRSTPPEGWVLYDGQCGFCSGWLRFWEPTLARQRLWIAALQEDWVRGRLRLSPEELLYDIRLLTPDGRLISGADVYLYVTRRIWWAWPFYAIFSLPGFRSLLDWGYRWFARHRLHLSHACGLQPPGKQSN